MKALKFVPEGWNNEITKVESSQIENYIRNNETLQGLVNKCDEQYNLYINLGNGIQGIIPRQEVEAINLQEDGLPKVNLCTGKVHKFVQFKVKNRSEDNRVI